jgi:hypothetical protein
MLVNTIEHLASVLEDALARLEVGNVKTFVEQNLVYVYNLRTDALGMIKEHEDEIGHYEDTVNELVEKHNELVNRLEEMEQANIKP